MFFFFLYGQSLNLSPCLGNPYLPHPDGWQQSLPLEQMKVPRIPFLSLPLQPGHEPPTRVLPIGPVCPWTQNRS